MSGHSKWANIKVKKTAEDKKRSVIFTKVAKDIRVAVKSGGGADPKINAQLRSVLEKARQVNMPKDNIDRILTKFNQAKDGMETFFLEGFGPALVPVVVEIETDSKIRTTNEVRLILEKAGGRLGENNSVMHLFDKVGRVELEEILEDDYLKLIDLGAIDILGNIVYTDFENLGKYVKEVIEAGFEVIDSGVFFKPKTAMEIQESDRQVFLKIVSDIEDNEDVLSVFSGLKMICE